jgi:phosphoribosylformimino-5-aminoimidazole carboxamide ribotide isomerase
MRFRPCIDLKNGKVVQIVGGSLSSDDSSVLTNFETETKPEEFARLYQKDALSGGHVIALGPGNENAATEALSAFPGGMHYGGGVNPENASIFLDAGASHVIVTSYVFSEGRIDFDRLKLLVEGIGRDRLVLDLSCRRKGDSYWVVTDRWTRYTELEVSAENLSKLSEYCDEFLVHGVDVEGKMSGIEGELVSLLGESSPIPVTYAGGARSIEDLDRVDQLGQGRVDLTIGSALDIFGGSVSYAKVASWVSPCRA